MRNSVPYDKLATIYDRVMAHVNYKAWSGYIKTLLAHYPGKVTHVADIACGTGKHAYFLKKHNFRIIGLDLSIGMLQAAKNNLGGTKPAIKLIQANSADLPLRSSSQQAVLMLYDSINYLIKKRDVEKLLQEVWRVLRPNGLFIFDVVTKHGVRICFDNYYESDNWDGLAYQRHGWYENKKGLQYNDFQLLYRGESFSERHIQKIRSYKTWQSLIQESPLQLLQALEDLTHKPAKETSDRIHFICKKKV